MKLEELLSQKIELSDLLEKAGRSEKKYKVVHLCMQDFGGAGKAAYRLHKGLQSIGLDSAMLVLNKKSGDPTVKVLPVSYAGDKVNCLDAPAYNSPIWNQQCGKWQTLLSNYPGRPAGLEMFTDAESSVRLDHIREIQEADIINLHWVAGAMDYSNAGLALMGKPIVWTLHDMNPFTGGCHYTGNCLKYKTSCGACPQLGSDITDDLSYHTWNHKLNAYSDLNIHIVALSRWLAGCAKESALFSRFPIDLIPNGFPLDIFKPYPKTQIRKASNVSETAKLILFGADSVVNQRKGLAYLLEALNRFPLKSGHEYILVTFGNFPQGANITSKYQVLNTGQIADENQLALVYSAADLFVLPSLEDNLPNTVVEAMACGLPIVGFDIGGMPDMVEHGKTGYLAKPRDIAGLAEGINWVISSYDNGVNFSERCREKAEKEYAPDVQAKAYNELYNRILADEL
ncbi:glycosyltransferase family 4 protein [Desulfonema magnum]|uniref:Glycosyltransferase, family I n=1 Tax=Desulfonema magnum TaxID=45655 RepID=A0A975BME0_9BACT|nr:glycosyltransferase family 4 protein [Desulfonema magnum]QTA87917.1 Glycosyltransferase, family I [Desulfonema magnum]